MLFWLIIWKHFTFLDLFNDYFFLIRLFITYLQFSLMYYGNILNFGSLSNISDRLFLVGHVNLFHTFSLGIDDNNLFNFLLFFQRNHFTLSCNRLLIMEMILFDWVLWCTVWHMFLILVIGSIQHFFEFFSPFIWKLIPEFDKLIIETHGFHSLIHHLCHHCAIILLLRYQILLSKIQPMHKVHIFFLQNKCLFINRAYLFPYL